MRALKEHLGVAGLLLAGPLIFAGALAGLIAFLGALHAMSPFVFMGAVGWFLFKTVGEGTLKRQQRQRAIREEKARMDVLIQTHLAAHRLLDTPQNRWHVLQLLSKPRARGR